MLEKSKALIFDFDGVILDSVQVKTNAFGEMYKSYGDDIYDKVVQYHLIHGGISRFEKFKYYEETLLGIPPSEKKLNELAITFNNLVFDGVVNSPYLPGVREFLNSQYGKRLLFICTGTPETEIHQIVYTKELEQYFRAVYGSPATKVKIINRIINETGFKASDIVFFGDAMTDYNAAYVTGCSFIGVTDRKGNHPFPDGTFVIQSFRELKLNSAK